MGRSVTKRGACYGRLQCQQGWSTDGHAVSLREVPATGDCSVNKGGPLMGMQSQQNN